MLMVTHLSLCSGPQMQDSLPRAAPLSHRRTRKLIRTSLPRSVAAPSAVPSFPREGLSNRAHEEPPRQPVPQAETPPSLQVQQQVEEMLAFQLDVSLGGSLGSCPSTHAQLWPSAPPSADPGSSDGCVHVTWGPGSSLQPSTDCTAVASVWEVCQQIGKPVSASLSFSLSASQMLANQWEQPPINMDPKLTALTRPVS